MASPSTLDEMPKNSGSDQEATTLSLSAPIVIDDLETTSRFAGGGVDFKGKLIGIEEVADARGDKMCQVAMAKLKAGVKAMGDHKQRVTINVSLDGVKIIDEKTSEILHSHEVKKISFIARDSGDSRAFGYVYRAQETSHQFFGVKTEKAAEGLVLSLRDLFQTVYEIKKKKLAESKNETESKPPAPATEEKIEADKPSEEDNKCSNDNKASENIADILLDIDLGLGSAHIKDSSSTTVISNNGGLSPIPTFFDPWGSSSSSVVQPLQQTQHTIAFGAGSVPHQGSSHYQQLVYPPTGIAPSLLAPPFQSSGNAFVTTPMVNPAFPGYSATTGVTTPNFHGKVGWPSTMVAVPVAGGVPSGQQWASASYPTSTGSGVAAPVPGLNPNSSGTVRDAFSPLALPSQGPVPLVPARRISPSNPFAAPLPYGARSDPFAEFALVGGGGSGQTSSSLSGTGLPHPVGRKTEKKDFFQDAPKPPSLFDLTQQQQTQPVIPVRDLFGSTQIVMRSAAGMRN